MAWIKRNLIFVIIVVVGLGLTGYCGYLLYTVVTNNAATAEKYESTSANYKQMQEKNPTPSDENIKAAQADQARVGEFLANFRKSFAAFPPPPAEDERGFKTYLEESLVAFRAGATNAGVAVVPDYAFSFSGLIGKLTYPPGNLGPWMQELQEISAILNVLYTAKINALDGLQRVPVGADDNGQGDCLSVLPVTNQWGVVTPYKINFHAFSTELAAVLAGFARASNCFIVKSVDVVNFNGGTPSVTQGSVASMPDRGSMLPAYAQLPPPSRDFRLDRGGDRLGGLPRSRPAPVPYTQTPTAAPSGPVTVLAETPLTVILNLDVVKLTLSEH